MKLASEQEMKLVAFAPCNVLLVKSVNNDFRRRCSYIYIKLVEYILSRMFYWLLREELNYFRRHACSGILSVPSVIS